MFLPGFEVKKKDFVIIFQKENGNTFTLLTIFIVKSLQKEQNSTHLLLCRLICRNISVITPKRFNSLDTNSKFKPCSNLKRQSTIDTQKRTKTKDKNKERKYTQGKTKTKCPKYKYHQKTKSMMEMATY